MMARQTNRQVLLARRSDKAPRPEDFEISDGAIPNPVDGQLLVRNSFLLLDLPSAGKIKVREDITDGLEHAPSAFIGMLSGANLGKTIIKL